MNKIFFEGVVYNKFLRESTKLTIQLNDLIRRNMTKNFEFKIDFLIIM